MAMFPGKHAWIVVQRFYFPDSDSLVVRMCWIHQIIALVGSEDGRHEQQAMFSLLHEDIAELRESWRRCSFTPICRQTAGSNLLPAQILREFRYRQDQIRGRIVLVEVDKILQHGQRLMFGGIAEASARAGPTSTVKISSFAVEGIAGIGSA